MSVEDFALRLPSPEALLLHKLIIAQRRTGRDKALKKEKDLQQCAVLVEVVRMEEIGRIIQEYRLSKNARKSLHESCVTIRLKLPDILEFEFGGPFT